MQGLREIEEIYGSKSPFGTPFKMRKRSWAEWKKYNKLREKYLEDWRARMSHMVREWSEE